MQGWKASASAPSSHSCHSHRSFRRRVLPGIEFFQEVLDGGLADWRGKGGDIILDLLF
jgi:hypothetical protein